MDFSSSLESSARGCGSIAVRGLDSDGRIEDLEVECDEPQMKTISSQM